MGYFSSPKFFGGGIARILENDVLSIQEVKNGGNFARVT